MLVGRGASVPAPSPRGARGGRRWGLAAALPAALLFLALSVLFAQPATALSGPQIVGAAMDVAESVAAPAAEVLTGGTAAAGGAGCLATLVCAGIIGTGALAWAAFQTRDTWLPIVKGLIGQGGTSTDTSGATGCPVSVTNPVMSGQSLSGSYSWSSCSLMQRGYDRVYVLEYTCTQGDSVVSTGNGTGVVAQAQPSFVGTASGSNTFTISLCAAGATLTGVVFHVDVDNAPAKGVSPTYSISPAATDPSKMSQTTKVTCVLGDGTVQGTVTATSTGTDAVIEVPSCGAKYPGTLPSEVVATAGLPGSESPVLDQKFNNVATQYPDCFDSGGHFLASCVVRVWINGSPCHVGVQGCVSWTTAAQDYGDTVECRFGPYVVAMSDCNELRRSYQSGASTRTLTVTDPAGSPADSTDPGASPSSSAQPTSGTNPTTDSAPVPGTSTAANSSSCWGTGWSWNPVSWVVIPVKCALSWAFLPANPPSFSDVPSPLPAGWVPSFPSLTDGSCGELDMPKLDMTKLIGTVGPTKLFNTCDAPWPTVRSVTYYGLEALALVGVGMAGFRAVMSALGMGVEVPAGGDEA